ncbi:helix-turn-helix domain-containing protein [Streptomyces sp. NPDC002602]|uniref:helix-turn-helix domain-containing protein n=1 Tax=Streptomyces sp. NPDC002602 TaxID=3364654 RepID=UPI0036AE60C2
MSLVNDATHHDAPDGGATTPGALGSHAAGPHPTGPEATRPQVPDSNPAAAALSGLLRLLAEGAPAEHLTTAAARARDGGACAAEAALVEEAARAALGIRRTLDQHRRREAELTALFDTAGDLAALRDLDSVLRAIVRRARTLLGTDVAYLTLNDATVGDTFMRVTDGSVSAAFQQLRLGMGEGLGGLVAQTARPYASSDYRADGRFRHTTAIDRGVGEEGIRGILGVPLRVGTRVIGVLYAADRAVRAFAPDAVALLSSLADHAAVAIDGARLLEETRAALVELNEANETVRAHSEAMRLATETHDRLTELVLRGGEIADLAREVAALLGGGIVIHDVDGTELARVACEPIAPPVRGVAESRSGGRAVPVDGTWVWAVLAGPELLGSIALTGRAPLTESERRLFERAGLVTALLLLLRRSIAEAEDRVRGELLGDLLAPEDGDRARDAGSLTLRARRLGLDLARPHSVLVLHCEEAVRARLAAETARRARSLRGLSGAYEGRVVLVVPAVEPGDRPGPVARSLAAELGRVLETPVTVGAAGPADRPGGLSAAHAEALRCVEALHTLNRTGHGAALPDLGFLGVLLGDRADVGGYVERVLGPVIAYDHRRGTELVRTLDAYYAHGGSLSRAKDALHVHVNTVVQRLERIRRLLGDDWNSPASALELQLALRLHGLSSR